MKKIILTGLLVVGLLVTGCMIKGEANVAKTEMETLQEVDLEEDVVEDVFSIDYTEEYVMAMRDNTIKTIEETYVEEGISEDCKDDIIELLMSIEYDPSYEFGYDVDTLQRNYVDILVAHDMLPEECAGHTLDELESGEF